jgi:hypothetical protein
LGSSGSISAHSSSSISRRATPLDQAKNVPESKRTQQYRRINLGALSLQVTKTAVHHERAARVKRSRAHSLIRGPREKIGGFGLPIHKAPCTRSMCGPSGDDKRLSRFGVREGAELTVSGNRDELVALRTGEPVRGKGWFRRCEHGRLYTSRRDVWTGRRTPRDAVPGREGKR